MASTLSVSVSSTFQAKTVVEEGRKNSAQATYINQTNSKVKEIRISHYELLESKILGFERYAVLICSQKDKLFASMLQEVKQDFSMIDKDSETLEQHNSLAQLAFYRKKQLLLEPLPNKLLVMNVLDSAFVGDSYLQKMQKIKAKYQDLHTSISFFIDADKQAVVLKAPVAKGLTKKGFALKKTYGERHFTVYISAAVNKAEAYGFSLARTTINIITKDYKGVVLGTNTLQINGQSSQGYAIAKQDVASRLEGMISKEGIAKVLALDI